MGELKRDGALTHSRRRGLRTREHHVALRGQQDAVQVAGVAAIHRAHGQGIGPHAIVRQTMDAHESSCGKLRAESLHSGKVNQLQVHDRKWRAETRHRGSNFAGRLCNGEVAELFTEGRSQAVGRNCIVVSENNIDWPHGKPFSSAEGTAVAIQ